MRRFSKMMLVVAFVTAAVAQTTEPPLSDTRLSISTLVREDLFAGFLSNDMERLARGERSIQSLLETRPAAKPGLLAWQASAALFRAVLAHEGRRGDEFQRHYRRALDLFAEARQLRPQDTGVAAVTGGTYVLFADRLPEAHRAAAWAQAYDAFQLLWQQQGRHVDKLPVHLRGELLGGLAQSAQRTGRAEEAAQHLDRLIELLGGTPYEPAARKWKANPAAARNTSVTCLTCHESGRLGARLSALNSQ
jgi:putative intracellular protease/amidase